MLALSKYILKVVKATVVAVLGWPFYGFSYCVRRKKDKYVFGICSSNFTGNVKVLYLDDSFVKGSVKLFLYRDAKIKDDLDRLNVHIPCLYYSIYSVRGVYHALTAKYYVYSNYANDINFWLSNGAVKFNVWHGTPLKTIERDVRVGVYSNKNKWRWFLKYIFPYFYLRPNKILICSDYEKACFKSAFDIRNESSFVRSFPPRLNSVVQQRDESDKNIILYCPTWRDDGSFSFEKTVDINQLNERMLEVSLTFVIKPHPSDKSVHLSREFSNVVLESNSTDIYDFLSRCALLITDYSSMMFDAAYCKIPVILFCPDLAQYQVSSREFYTDIESLGLPLIANENDLFEEIQNMKNTKLSYTKNEFFNVYTNNDICL